MALQLEIDRYCFVCGPDNPAGLHATLECADGKATGRYLPRPEHQGYTGISHGGILAALLDEVMVYAAATLGHWVATAEMTVRYSKPAPTGQPLTLHGEVTRHQRRLVECRAEIRADDGTVLASATGKLMKGRALRSDEHQGGGELSVPDPEPPMPEAAS
ncbi:MAG TPA: PaaI family thioesterase [Armatimonadota bacterium]|nr:PaaI family thioesterase [Armatimonadota bacterium]